MSCVRGCPRGFGDQYVVTLSIQGRHESYEHASERVVHDKWGRLWLK